MYKYYICIIMNKDAIAEITGKELVFDEGHVRDPEIYRKLEDYLGQPVVFLRESTVIEDEILIMCADGVVQTNPITKKRTAIIKGTLEDLKVIMADVIKERDEKPKTTFHGYGFGCIMPEQLALRDWFTENYPETE